MSPLLLGRFPPTPVVAAIPALLTIALIMVATALLVRVSNAGFRAIGHGRVRLPAFYPEWATPTARLVALGLLIGGLVAAYPLIPGSGTRSFQGAGPFVGLLAALGSSAVATTVTISYDVNWRRVHALLLDAARSVAGVSASPEPSELQTVLNDVHVSDAFNAYVEEVNRYRETRSDLRGDIQDRFAAADVEILSPGYHAIRDGHPRTAPS